MFWCSLHQCIWWFQWLCAQRLLCERTVSALTCVTVETGVHGGRRRPAYWPAWSERGPRWVRVLPVGECGCTCVVCSRQHLSFQKPVGVLGAKPSILVFLWCLMWLRFCACIWPCAYVQGRKKKLAVFSSRFDMVSITHGKTWCDVSGNRTLLNILSGMTQHDLLRWEAPACMLFGQQRSLCSVLRDGKAQLCCIESARGHGFPATLPALFWRLLKPASCVCGRNRTSDLWPCTEKKGTFIQVTVFCYVLFFLLSIFLSDVQLLV